MAKHKRRRGSRKPNRIAVQPGVQDVPAPLAAKRARSREGKRRLTATPERMAKADSVSVGQDGTRRLASPLESLRAKKAITIDQFRAGDQYCRDFEAAGLMRSPASCLDIVGGGYGSRASDISGCDRREKAARRINAANTALRHRGLIDVVRAVALAPAGERVLDIALAMPGCQWRDPNQARVALIATLKIALDCLSELYAPTPRPRVRAMGERARVDESQWAD